MSKFVIDLDDPQEKWDSLYELIESEEKEPAHEEPATEGWVPYHGFWLLAGIPDS